MYSQALVYLLFGILVCSSVANKVYLVTVDKYTCTNWAVKVYKAKVNCSKRNCTRYFITYYIEIMYMYIIQAQELILSLCGHEVIEICIVMF